MGEVGKSDGNNVLAKFFTGQRVKVKRSMTVISTGSSIFYDNLIAEEAKEKAKQKKKQQKEKKTQNEKKTKEEEENSQIILIKNYATVRFRWEESEPVLSSGVLDRITAYDKTLMEAKFEIITTEVTYLNALNELITKFMENEELSHLCTRGQWQDLFSNIAVVKAASELVLSDLVQHWSEDIMLTNIYTVLRQHAISILRVCKEYCRKQLQAQTLLAQLREDKAWRTKLLEIESETSPHHSLQSYLSLPMQRVTRLPLLLDNVAARLQEGTNEFTACKLATTALKKLAKECNECVGQDEENPVLQLIEKGTSHKEKTATRTRPASWSSTTSWEV